MRLISLEVTNYRAIRHGALHFTDTTILIGENKSGRSSLMEALTKILGETDPYYPEFQPYHYHRIGEDDSYAGAIVIKIRFSEKMLGQWDGNAFAPLHGLISQSTEKKRTLVLGLRSDPKAEREPSQFELVEPIKEVSTRDRNLISWLRKTNQVTHLRPGMLTGYGLKLDLPIIEMTYPNALLRSLAEEIQRTSWEVLTHSSMNINRSIERGFAAVQQLFEILENREGRKESSTTTLKVREIVQMINWEEIGSISLLIKKFNGIAEKLGILLLINAFIRSDPGESRAKTNPILIIEDPEAHLHPMAVASLAMLMGKIRWQMIAITYSGKLLGSFPLRTIRRIVRRLGVITEYKAHENNFNTEELRRLGFHLRSNHSMAPFARLWMLVEGESEFWIIPQLARIMGYNFDLEGIVTMNFTHSGLRPLIKYAKQLGIKWHVLVDGDTAGERYQQEVMKFTSVEDTDNHLTFLEEQDIENYFWSNGFEELYRRMARMQGPEDSTTDREQTLRRAIRNHSKPFLALCVVESIVGKDSKAIPKQLADMIVKCIEQARAP